METAGNRNQRSRRREEKVWVSASVMAQMASIGIAIKKERNSSTFILLWLLFSYWYNWSLHLMRGHNITFICVKCFLMRKKWQCTFKTSKMSQLMPHRTDANRQRSADVTGQSRSESKNSHALLYPRFLYFLAALPPRATCMSLVGPLMGFRAHYHLLKSAAGCCAIRRNTFPGALAAWHYQTATQHDTEK